MLSMVANHTAIKVACVPKQALQVELYDYDSMDADDLIGEAKFDVKEMGDQEEKDLWLDIVPVKPEKGSHKVCEPFIFEPRAHLHSCLETRSICMQQTVTVILGDRVHSAASHV